MSDLDYRSWGETKNCHGCRYWSEMLARGNDDNSELVAYCLNRESPNSGKWVSKGTTCKAWKSGEFGAIDSPGGDPYLEETK